MYDAFTDIAFNPQKSLNCQAEAVAIFVSLKRQKVFEEATKDMHTFLKCVYQEEPNEKEENYNQLSFI